MERHYSMLVLLGTSVAGEPHKGSVFSFLFVIFYWVHYKTLLRYWWSVICCSVAHLGSCSINTVLNNNYLFIWSGWGNHLLWFFAALGTTRVCLVSLLCFLVGFTSLLAKCHSNSKKFEVITGTMKFNVYYKVEWCGLWVTSIFLSSTNLSSILEQYNPLPDFHGFLH